jgi:2-(1,2-epoxy-1,2-dihydrophenyl)acetyl-CoA isomerase
MSGSSGRDQTDAQSDELHPDLIHPDLIHTVTDGVARITLNRPDAGNALTPDQRDRLIELFDEASADLAVRVVVLRANGKHFCTGADLRAPRPPDPPRPEGAPERALGDVGRTIRRGAQRLVTSIIDCEKPVIAEVGGTAAGLGAHLALACDLIVAADSARFIEVFVRRGITPDGGGAYLLPRMIGLAKSKELMFFGDDLSAPDAERIGLINKVVPADDLGAAVGEWAARLAVAPTKAVSLTKWLVNRSLDSDRVTAFADEAWAQDMASTTRDFNEGVQAFVERRDVEFKGW